MATTTRPVILLCTTDEGHASISQAIHQQLEGDFEVVTFHRPLLFHRGYQTIYRRFPGLFGLAYKLGSFSKAQPWQEIMAEKRFYREMKRTYLEHRPVAIICTYFAFLPALAKLEREYKIPILNIVANPVSIHPMEISNDISLNVVFDQDALTTARELNPEAHIEAWGWFVRRQFQPTTDKKELRQQLQLHPELPLVLISGGSEGTQKTYDVVLALAKEKVPCQCVVMCGSNTGLYQKLSRLGLEKDSPTQVLPLGFTSEMHRYLAAADLFVTKAGPNSIFEATTCQVPQVIFSHIAGQETGNLGLIANYGVGVVAEEIDMTVSVVKNMITNSKTQMKSKTLVKMLAATPHHLHEWLATSVSHGKK